MSMLVNGILEGNWVMETNRDGEFIRKDSQFRSWITPDGSPGSSGMGGFEAESGRYHLYVSYACPWAHRTLIFRKLKQLEDHISVSVVLPDMPSESWKFGEYPGATPDHLHGFDYLWKVYTKAESNYSGIVTVPVLWDKKQNTIVNNESAEIIRIFNSAFNAITGNEDDYYPKDLHDAINKINQPIYDNVNNGVYRCGFATTQAAYERGFDRLFNTLNELEELLGKQRYLTGSHVTEADWRLLPTLLRFDPVYYSHFKCNLCRIIDYPNLSNYMRDLFQTPGVKETFNLDHVKRHYYWSHDSINPTRIVPKGPLLDYDAPHDRGRFV